MSSVLKINNRRNAALVLRVLSAFFIGLGWFVACMDEDMIKGLMMGGLWGIAFWWTLPRALLFSKDVPSKSGIVIGLVFVGVIYSFGWYFESFDHPLLQALVMILLMAAILGYNFTREQVK